MTEFPETFAATRDESSRTAGESGRLHAAIGEAAGRPAPAVECEDCKR